MENIVQATARDILAFAMKNLRDCQIVMHIHDEVVIEAPPELSLQTVCDRMSTTPPWMPGLLLRADGYDIDAVTNRGYCLRARPDTLTAGDVLPYLPEARRATVRCFAQIDSTNSYLKAEAMRGAPDGLCAIADRQTAGRGQKGNSWESEDGKNLTFSMLLKHPGIEAKRQFYMSEAVSLAVAEMLSHYTEGISIKWPNDVYWADRKMCGMLIENSMRSHTSCSSASRS